jgi:hypothetical protein
MSEEKKASVDRLADANTGDWLWVYDEQRARYSGIGKAQKFDGRGDWVGLYQVTKISRKYLSAKAEGASHRMTREFDKKTGDGKTESGYSSSYIIMGEEEKQDRLFRSTFDFHTIEWALRSASRDQLKAIMEILNVSN